MTTNLTKVLAALDKNRNDAVNDYAIPRMFNEGVPGWTYVNPWRFFRERIIATRAMAAEGIDYARPLSYVKSNPTAAAHWAHEAIYYSALIRASAAWDADQSGVVETVNRFGLKETGTCVKMLALLPHLSRMGVDALYLLPINRRSLARKKGELGSPYAVSDFFTLDDDLKDPMTGNDTCVDIEFAALVEAAHCHGLRVIIDIVPRTMGVDNVWLSKHPDWFYWIAADALEDYRPPQVETLSEPTAATPLIADKLYASADVKRHLRRFRPDPRTLNPDAWRAIADTADVLGAIQQTMGITIAPAFSDVVNDNQPPWSDITALRLYLDHPASAQEHISKSHTPYLLHDVLKASRNEGRRPNTALWRRLTDIVPHFQNKYGIDGVRIDMGHALPEALLTQIIAAARNVDRDVAIIAEELDPSRGADAKRLGYDIIVGDAFYKIPRVEDGSCKRFYTEARHTALPVFACAETHDTPRIAQRLDETYACLIAALNFFTPNAAPFINSAQEVFAKAAMNHGLDVCSQNEHEKLALFDRVAFDYAHPRAHVIAKMLERLHPLRKRYLDALTDNRRARVLETPAKSFLGFKFETSGNTLFVLANLSENTPLEVDMTLFLTGSKETVWTRRLQSSDVFAAEQTEKKPTKVRLKQKEVLFYEIVSRSERLAP